MCRFIETIQVKNCKIQRAEYHNARMNDVRRKIWHASDELDVRNFLSECGNGVWKFRLVYGKRVEETSVAPYKIRPVNSLQIIENNEITYSEKSEDRAELNALFAQRNACDDILIVRNGLLTDTSIGNIALFDGSRWLTPENPLLRGTKRQFLLDNGFVFSQNLTLQDLQKCTRIRIFNAMIDFGEIDFPTDNIQLK